MTALQFNFIDVTSEIDAFSRLSGDYIAPESKGVLESFKSDLLSIQGSTGARKSSWQIRDARPLMTKPSVGKYEKGVKRGGPEIFAEITSIWEIQNVVLPNRRNGPAKKFELVGNASTRIRIMRPGTSSGKPEELAMWRMEIGDAASPGCHFHVQVLGERADGPFPKSVPVPRFPNLLVTPMAIAEFVLGELFQDDWQKDLGRSSDALNRWTTIQNNRWKKILDWKCSVLSSPGSPWLNMKNAKPKMTLFVSD